MVAAGALVTPGKQIVRGELWGGSPARMMRQLSAEESAYINDAATHYVEMAKTYQASITGRNSTVGEP